MKAPLFIAATLASILGNLQAMDLSGSVVDLSGQALAGAHISIYTAGPKTGVIPFCPSCYPECRKSAVSDASGHFSITGLNPTLRFQLLAIAEGRKPTFMSRVDPAAGEVEIAIPPRDLSGIPARRLLTGRVVGPDGSPLAGATVKPCALLSGTQRTGEEVDKLDPLSITDQHGDFFIVAHEPGCAVSVVVESRGLAKKVFKDLAADGRRHELALRAGALVEGRLLAPNGRGAPNVKIGLMQTDRQDFAECHLGSFEAETDASGHFAFADLPPDRPYHFYAVADRVGPLGLAMATKTIQVGGKGTITKTGDTELAPATRVTSQVILADGHAVPPATRVIVRREPFESQVVDLDAQGRFTVSGVVGERLGVTLSLEGYKVSWKNKDVDELHDTVFVQLVAGAGEKKLLLDPEKKPALANAGPAAAEAVPLKGIVLLPDHQPAVGLKIISAGLQNSAQVIEGKVQLNGPPPPSAVTDAAGRFTLPQPPRPGVLLMVCPQGYAQVKVDEAHPTMAITLKPWNRIEGRLFIGSKPVVRGEVEAFYAGDRIYDPAAPQISFDWVSKTDEHGHYVIECVPEGIVTLGRRTGSEHAWGQRAQSISVDAGGGKTLRLDLGGSGRAVTGKIAIPPQALDQVDWEAAGGDLNLVQEEVAVPPGLNDDERHAWARAWYASEAGRKETLHERSYSFVVDRDSAFRIEDVAPGKYRFLARFRRNGTEHNEMLGYAQTTVTVPAGKGGNRPGGVLAIGSVPLQIQEKDLASGDKVPDFEVTALDGRVITNKACEGKVVLLYFWKASSYRLDWDIKPLLELQELFGTDKRFEIVSLAMNEQRKDLEQFAEQNPLPWPQAYVGDLEKSPIPKSFRVRGWPSVFLIGPDGKFIETVARVSTLKAKIARALEP